MKEYVITKVVKAKSFQEAILKEPKGEIIQIHESGELEQRKGKQIGFAIAKHRPGHTNSQSESGHEG